MKNESHPCAILFVTKKIFFAAAMIVAASLVSSRCYAQQKAPWVTPKASQQIKNPFAADKIAVAQGKTLYTANCAPCHGNSGKGDGAAAAALNPKPANHTSAAVQSETDGSLYWKVSTGRNPMPSYKTIFTDKQRWALIDYIRTLAKKK